MAGVFASGLLIAGCGDDGSDAGSGGSDEKITGNVTSEEALTTASTDMDKALKTF